MNESNLRRGIFTLRMTGGEENGYIKITNSTWGHLNVSSGFNIEMSDCNFKDAITYVPMLDVSFCNITIQSSTLHNENFSILKGLSSDIKITNTTFISSSTSEQLAIHLQKCNLSMMWLISQTVNSTVKKLWAELSQDRTFKKCHTYLSKIELNICLALIFQATYLSLLEVN